MDKKAYDDVKSRLVAMASVVSETPLDEFIKAGEQELNEGPRRDPALWDVRYSWLDDLLKMARALRTFRAEVDRQVSDGKAGIKADRSQEGFQ